MLSYQIGKYMSSVLEAYYGEVNLCNTVEIVYQERERKVRKEKRKTACWKRKLKKLGFSCSCIIY